MTPAAITILTASVGAVVGLVSSLVTMLVTRRGQDQTAASALRDDLMQLLGRHLQRIETLEARVASSDARFQAREAQLIEWGTWDPADPPRRAPVFIWPPAPDTAPTGGV